MKDRSLVVSLIAVIVLLMAGGAFLLWDAYQDDASEAPPVAGPTSIPPADNGPSGGSGADIQRMTLAGGDVDVSYPADEYGLAISQDQVLVEAVIPPCSIGFEYCLYYIDDRYEGTNFESAGLRIERRPDLSSQQECLNTQPAGHSGLAPVTASYTEPDHAVSAFTSVRGSGAGHSAEGALYRLIYNGMCYELETRIGTSQPANFPPGSVREFTAADRGYLENSLRSILDSVTLVPGGAEVVFP